MDGKSSIKRIRLLTGSLLAALASFVAIAPAAQAGPLVQSAPNCSNADAAQVFLPWADPASYVLNGGGAFEDGAAGWTLADGASVVSGNESYAVHGSADANSLSLPAGSSATSSTSCVGIEHPDIRFFVTRTSGSVLATLKVEVLFEDANGNVLSAPIGVTTGSGSWQPTLPMPIVVNLLPLLPDNYTPVQFRFTPQGGTWQIDDLYVDPWRH